MSLELPPLPIPPPKPPREDETLVTLGWIGIGVGGAGVALGVGNGVAAIMKASDLEEVCGGDGSCPASEASRVDSLDFTRVVSTTGFVVGAVGLAVGIPLLLLGKEGSGAPQSSALTPWVGPNGAGLSGRF